MKPPVLTWSDNHLMAGSKTLARIDPMLGRPGHHRIAMLLPPVTYGNLPMNRADAMRIAEISVCSWFEGLPS